MSDAGGLGMVSLPMVPAEEAAVTVAALAMAALDTGDLVLIEAVLPAQDVPPLALSGAG